MIDHLLWGVPDLAAGCRDLAERTGVTPAVGGRHPDAGTHNALLDLGADRYLELIARDPAERRLAAFGEHLAGLTAPRLLTWCARAADLAAVAAAARRAGLAPGEVLAMSRRRPDGTLLAWRLLLLAGHPYGGLVPFFIDWGDTPHPSRSAPAGCRLARFALRHPEAPALARLLAALGVAAEVAVGPAPELRADLVTPRGPVELGG